MLACSAQTGAGLDAVWEKVTEHRARLEASGGLAERRAGQQVDWMWQMVRDGLMDRLLTDPAVRDRLPALTEQVRSAELTPTLAARALLDAFG